MSPALPKALRLFRDFSFNAADLANAVNHFIALGEDEAVRELGNYDPNHDLLCEAPGKVLSLRDRRGWLCRILFCPKGNPLRPPAYGITSLPQHSMPLSRWPLYPLAASGDSFFVLSTDILLAGAPENPKKYTAYCQAEGTFRHRPVPVPTRAQAQKDVTALRQSPAWKDIKWEERGYSISEEWVWRFIKAQADTIE
jgi:hypothetical protein